MLAADDAELRGDAVAALEIMGQHVGEGTFWRPWRVRRLYALALLGPGLPAWVTSRWILAQALQHLTRTSNGGPGRRRVAQALAIAVELRGGPQGLPGVDAMDAQCRVMDHDWVYRQLHLYELGGLAHFLRVAPSDLVAGADRIHDWAAAPMGGYRLVGRDAATVDWEDLGTGVVIRTANIGTAAMVLPRACVIGRLVPIEGGRMFEGAPLLVPEPVAFEVAGDPTGWVECLRSACGAHPGLSERPCGDVHGLLTDVPEVAWALAMRPLSGLAPTSTLTDGEMISAVINTARAVLESDGSADFHDPEALDPWACIAAALLEPDVIMAMGRVPEAVDRSVLVRLADVLAEPAASACRDFASDLGRAA